MRGARCWTTASPSRAISPAGHEVAGVGIGVCELVSGDGRIWSEQTLPWRGLDVEGALGAVAPAVVASDVRAAALAEARFGAARGAGHVVYVTVGTGISFTLVVGGVPYAGARGGALTFGTVPLALGADALEDVASGLALARLGGVAGARELLELAAAGDENAAAIVAHGARALGVGIAALVNLLDPAIVVIGGGLGSHPGYRAAVAATAREAIFADEARELPIVPAALGPDAGVVGAALSAVG